jgi:hypothetical protein
MAGQNVGKQKTALKSVGKKDESPKKPGETPELRKPAAQRSEAGRTNGSGRSQVVKRILESIEEKLSGNDVKATLGDYIRLVQLHRELDEERQPTEIKVTWVESTEIQTMGDRVIANLVPESVISVREPEAEPQETNEPSAEAPKISEPSADRKPDLTETEMGEVEKDKAA